jgi:FAD/FMN-containing dehydrogenase
MNLIGEHQSRWVRLAAELAAARAIGARIGLRKSTSNLFRQRDSSGKTLVDVRDFNRVLRVDTGKMIAEVEGMTTYEDFVEGTLQHGVVPAVVPQLKTITVGGAVSGLGIESSSFRYGLVHETVESMDILLGDGRMVHCSPCENADLFFGFPNSYGTLGYALKIAIRVIPARRYVRLTHTRFRDPETFFERMDRTCGGPEADYVDGTVFGADEMYLTAGVLSDDAPRVSDYTYMQIYYRSIQGKTEDWLTAHDYIWRWDTDWFWCSKQFYVQHPAIRWMVKPALNSRTYQRVMRVWQKIARDNGTTESVIQDVDIPVRYAPEFFRFLLREIGITPIWICPFRSPDPSRRFDLSPLDPATLYINFGFWDVIPTTHPPGHFNRKIEAKALDLGGAKGLYSSSYYEPEAFWSIYDGEAYRTLKQKYDPQGALGDLYEKCVMRR